MGYCNFNLSEVGRKFHDEEWGVPVHDDRRLFEFLVLAVMQCRSTWEMILRKREVFRLAFDGFDFDRIDVFCRFGNTHTGENVIKFPHVILDSMETDMKNEIETATQIETATGRVAASTGTVNRSVHNKVQLWEDGPYWADTNIGAEKPEDYGFYFWWGDTVGYKREGDAWVASDGSSSGFEFDEKHTPTCGKSLSSLTSDGWVVGGEERKSLLEKLFEKLFGIRIREDSVLTTKHDAAQVYWGGEWRMPTKQELKDLCNKCDWTWTTMNGANGYVVRGRGNYASVSIFLPCAGYGLEALLSHAGSTGAYWSSVPHSDFSNSEAWDLGFNLGRHGTSYYFRNYGQSVRPVQGFTK